MDEWLVRTTENWILGPLSKAEVCQMIADGKLDIQDEVCLANQYWFSLHEKEEVKKFLGIEVPTELASSRGEEEEITETQNELEMKEGEVTDPDVGQLPSLGSEGTTALTSPKTRSALGGSSMSKPSAGTQSISPSPSYLSHSKGPVNSVLESPVASRQKNWFSLAIVVLTLVCGIAFYFLTMRTR